MPNTKCKDVSIFMTTLKHSTEVAHQQLYIFIAARLVSSLTITGKAVGPSLMDICLANT